MIYEFFKSMLTVLCLVVFLAVPIDSGSVELSSTKTSQFTCLGDQVTFTCRVTGSRSLEWRSPLITQTTSYTAADTPLMPINRGPFTLSLLSVSGTPLNANFTSTLQVNASRSITRTETTVTCVNAASESETDNFTVAAVPTVPLNIAVNQVERVSGGGGTCTIIRLGWIQPQNFDQFDIDRYDITVTSTSEVQSMTTACGQCTSTVISVCENPNNVRMNTTFTATIAARNRCGETGPTGTASYTLINCGDPTAAGNGSIETYQNTTEGAEISFTCNPMFVPSTRMTASCTSNGMWTPDPASLICIIDCGQPVAPQRGSLETYTNTTEGSEVFYSCNPGLVAEGRMRAVCTDNGWNSNPADLICTEVNCGMPHAPENGIIENIQSISTVGGSQIFFRCNPGYVPAGRMSATCMSPDGMSVDGTWTPDPADLACNASLLVCEEPTLASGVIVVQPHNTTVSSVIVYQCQQSGFIPSPPSSVCGEDGRWSPDPSQVVCVMVPVSCGQPVTPGNGSIEAYQDTLEGAEIFFKCNPGFVPAGRMRAVCGADGRWNPDPAILVCTVSATVCEAPIFSSGASGVAVEPFSSTIVNSEILYQCQTGLLQEGRGTLLCREDGRWNPDTRSLCTDKSLSTAATAAITAVVCSLVMFITGTVCGVLLAVCISRWNKKRRSSKPAPNTQEQQTVVVYEEVDTQSKKIELEQNVAYGPVKQDQKFELEENVTYRPVKQK